MSPPLTPPPPPSPAPAPPSDPPIGREIERIQDQLEEEAAAIEAVVWVSEDIKGDNETQTMALINILVPVAVACVLMMLVTLCYLRKHHMLTTSKLHGLSSHARRGDKRFHHIHRALEEMNSGEFTVVVPSDAAYDGDAYDGDDSVGFTPRPDGDEKPPPPPSLPSASSGQGSGAIDPNSTPAELLAHVRAKQASRKQSVALTFKRATVLPTALDLIGPIDEEDDRASLVPRSEAPGNSMWRQKAWKKTLQREQGVLAAVEKLLAAHETNLSSPSGSPRDGFKAGVTNASEEAAKLRKQFLALKEKHDSDLEELRKKGGKVRKSILEPEATMATLALGGKSTQTGKDGVKSASDV